MLCIVQQCVCVVGTNDLSCTCLQQSHKGTLKPTSCLERDADVLHLLACHKSTLVVYSC